VEYMEGGDLLSYAGSFRTRMPEEAARFYSGSVALALDHLHQNGYVHRDLKPENVLLDRMGFARLADFGLSKRLTRGKRLGSGPGTALYMAPEALPGTQGTSFAADWWSYGVLVFELLTGSYPFPGRSRQEVYGNIRAFASKGFHFKTRWSSVIDRHTESAGKLLRGLLCQEKRRLSGKKIREHEWFRGLDWKEMQRFECAVPCWRIPADETGEMMRHGARWTPMTNTEQDSTACRLSEEAQGLFRDFSFDNNTSIILPQGRVPLLGEERAYSLNA